MKSQVLFIFLLFTTVSCGPSVPLQQMESRRDRLKVEAAVNSLPKSVHKTIKDMHAQGVPKDVIADKIKQSSKGTTPQKVVEGVLKDDPWKTEKANKDAKKRQAKLKNEVKKQQKQEKKKMRRGEL